MRILQVSPRYAPQTGGVETHVREISERLVDRGHTVHVHTADAGSDGNRHEEQAGVSVHRHRGLAPGGAFHLAPTIATAVRRTSADVVHAHNYHSLPLPLAAFTAGDHRFVATPHYHAGSPSSFRDRLLRAYRPIGGAALKRADAVIAVSQWERQRLREQFGLEPTLIPNGLDTDRFRNATPEARNRPYLLCVGRLERYKGVQHVIRTLPTMDKYELVIAGDGPFRSELERLAEREALADRVTFLGFVDQTRLPGLYAGAEVYLQLSEFEAYGMTVAEALAAGTACVVRKVGGLSEWTAVDRCVGVDDIESESIAAAVDAAKHTDDDPLMMPDWSEVVEALLRVYQGDASVTFTGNHPYLS